MFGFLFLCHPRWDVIRLTSLSVVASVGDLTHLSLTISCHEKSSGSVSFLR